MRKFHIGCDPELFLADAENHLVSAIGLVGGTKHMPRGLTELGHGFAVQEDNVAVEFNIPAAEGKEQFRLFVKRAMQYLSDEVGRMQLHFVNQASAVFPKDQLMHPMAREFGCDPDYNVWTGKANPRPRARNKALRSAGGHVHIGYQFFDRNEINETIKAMDVHLGLWSVLVDPDKDRRNLYGKAGAFRAKPYGVEYRTLSNFWVFNDAYIDDVYDRTAAALDAVQNKTDFDSCANEIQLAINNSDVQMAKGLMDHYGVKYA